MRTADQLVENLLNEEPKTPVVDFNDPALHEAATEHGVALTQRHVSLWNKEGNFAKIPLLTSQLLDWFSNHRSADYSFETYLAEDQPGEDE